MDVLYISGTVPDRRYTFIHREVEELRNNDIEVSFLILKPYAGKLNTSNGHIWFYPKFNPFAWLICPFLNLFIYKRSLLFSSEIFKILRGIDLKKTSWLRVILGAIFLESALYSLMKKGGNYSHIHSHHLFAATLFTPAIAKFLNTSYSLTLHTLSHYYKKPFLEKCIKNASFIRGVTNETFTFANQFNNTNSVYIPNSISLVLSRKEQIPSENPACILAIGKLMDKKGFDVLIKSCSLLVDKKVNFICKIIGEGPEKENLEKMIRQYNLANLVQIYPFKDFNDLIDDFMEASVLVMPSKDPIKSTRDGLPTVILEAMALKVPVVASDFAGISDAITDNETGLLIESNNESQLAERIQRILFDKVLAYRLTSNAFKRVKENYSLDINMKILSDHFKSQTV